MVEKGAMEVTNANGRKVSILNDEPPAYIHPRPPLRPSDHSRNSSFSTQMSRADSNSSQFSSLASPVYSPRATPQLVRLDSSSSQSTLQTPSPMTPNYPFDPLEQTKTVTPREPYYRPNGPYYSAMPQPEDVVPQPYYGISSRSELLNLDDPYHSLAGQTTLQTQLSYYTAPDPIAPITPQNALPTPLSANSTQPSPATATSSNANSAKIIKKKYPCPHAARFSCTDTFTTSGHAARHGKKHTGEKNILCPTCNKAFTRKDNMKQHERTHKAGREQTVSSNLPADPESGTQSAPGRRVKSVRSRSTTASSTPLMNMEVDMDDFETEVSSDIAIRSMRPQIRRSGLTDALGYTNPNLSIDTTLAENLRPNFERKVSTGSKDGEGDSPGLDALAMAASGVRG